MDPTIEHTYSLTQRTDCLTAGLVMMIGDRAITSAAMPLAIAKSVFTRNLEPVYKLQQRNLVYRVGKELVSCALTTNPDAAPDFAIRELLNRWRVHHLGAPPLEEPKI